MEWIQQDPGSFVVFPREVRYDRQNKHHVKIWSVKFFFSWRNRVSRIEKNITTYFYLFSYLVVIVVGVSLKNGYIFKGTLEDHWNPKLRINYLFFLSLFKKVLLHPIPKS